MEEQLFSLMFKTLGPWFTMIAIVIFAYWKLRGGNLIVLQNGSKKNGGKKTPEEAEQTLHEYRLIQVEKRLSHGDGRFKVIEKDIGEIKVSVGKLLTMAEKI